MEEANQRTAAAQTSKLFPILEYILKPSLKSSTTPRHHHLLIAPTSQEATIVSP